MNIMTYKKTEHFEPIAMKCTQEQFESIKPILERFGCTILDIDRFNDRRSCLTNNYRDGKISNIGFGDGTYKNIDILKTFNAETFLKACGIVSEPLYQLTAKEVVYAYENPQWLKDTFKECFVQTYTITEAEEKFNIKIKAVIKRLFIWNDFK